MIESRLDFIFDDIFRVIKFDETGFYKKFSGFMPNGKGVDFIADSENRIILLEIKNCTDYEQESAWRTHTDTTKLNEKDMSLDESFDIEVSKKVLSTIGCLAGANSFYKYDETAEELRNYFNGISSSKIGLGQKQIEVILFLEGDFKRHTRSKIQIMQRIRQKIKQKLKWLNCTVRVVDSDTYKERYFQVRKAR